MKLKNLSRKWKEKHPKSAPESRIFSGSCCIDEMSTWTPVDYVEPEVICKFLNEGENLLRKKISAMKLDQFNSDFFDRYIEQMICIALSDIDNQRIRHRSALLDIRIGQESRVNILRKELEQTEMEIDNLKSEVCI